MKCLSKVKSGYLDCAFAADIMKKGSPNRSRGSSELSPVLGHLGGREPTVKPTQKWAGFFGLKGGVFRKQSSSSMKNIAKGGNL